MVGWRHRLNGHEFEQTPGDSEGQGSLASCSPWGHKELDTTKWLNNIYILKNNMGGGKGINIYQQKKGDHLQMCMISIHSFKSKTFVAIASFFS